MSDIPSSASPLGSLGSVGAQFLAARGSAVYDTWAAVASKLHITFPQDTLPFTQQGHDGSVPTPGTIAWALALGGGGSLGDKLQQAQDSLTQAGANASVAYANVQALINPHDAGIGTFSFSDEYYNQGWYSGVLGVPWEIVAGATPDLGAGSQGFLARELTDNEKSWLVTPQNTYRGVTQNQDGTPGDWNQCLPDAWPGLAAGNIFQSIVNAIPAGPMSLHVQGTANIRWMCKFWEGRVSSILANVNTDPYSVLNAQLVALLHSVQTLSDDADKIKANSARLEVEIIAGMVALGAGEVFAEAFEAGALAGIVAELGGLLALQAEEAIAEVAARAAEIEGEDARLKAMIADLHTAVGEPDHTVSQMLTDRLQVTLADGTKQKLRDFLGRCVVSYAGRSYNLLSECRVLNSGGKICTVREALDGLVFTEPQSGQRKHAALHLVGIHQPNLSGEHTP